MRTRPSLEVELALPCGGTHVGHHVDSRLAMELRAGRPIVMGCSGTPTLPEGMPSVLWHDGQVSWGTKERVMPEGGQALVFLPGRTVARVELAGHVAEVQIVGRW